MYKILYIYVVLDCNDSMDITPTSLLYHYWRVGNARGPKPSLMATSHPKQKMEQPQTPVLHVVGAHHCGILIINAR